MAAMEPPKQRYQGIQKESAGYRLMSAMGWKEGEGLGAAKQGIKEHIRVKKNFENWGVGAVTASERARDWSTGMADFHRVLSTLSEITSQHAGKRRGEEDSDDDGETTLDEKSDASDGELKKKQVKTSKKESKTNESSKSEKKKKKEKKKSKRKVKSGDSCEDDSEDEDKGKKGNSSDEQKDEEAPAPKRVKLATHLGRFKKRENAKMVKNYSTHDLAAILGEDPFAAAAAAIAEAQPHAAPSGGGYSSDSESDSDEDDNKAGPRNATNKGGARAAAASLGKPPRPPKASQPTVVIVEDEDVDTTEYWWSNYFVRRGRMGSLRRAAPKRERGFSEQDQADLYTAAHDGATQGRVGLGRSSMPKKVAGARWEGKKVRLGSDSEGEEEEEEEREKTEVERMEEDDDAGNGIVIVLPGGKRVPASTSVPAASGPSDGTGNAKKTKWKRIIADVLKGEAEGMKMKALQKAVMEREGLGKESKNEVAAAVAAAVEGSAKFKLDGKLVRLVA